MGLALGTCKSPSQKSHASPAAVRRAQSLWVSSFSPEPANGGTKEKGRFVHLLKPAPTCPFSVLKGQGKPAPSLRIGVTVTRTWVPQRGQAAAVQVSQLPAACGHPKFLLTFNLRQRVPRTPAPTQRGWHGGVPEPASPQQAPATGPRESDLPFLGATGLQPQRDVAKRRGRKKNQIIGRKQRWLPHPGTGRAGGGGRRTPARWHDTTAPSGADCHLTLGSGASRSRQASGFFFFCVCFLFVCFHFKKSSIWFDCKEMQVGRSRRPGAECVCKSSLG